MRLSNVVLAISPLLFLGGLICFLKGDTQLPIIRNVATSVAAFLLTKWLIPKLAPLLAEKGNLYGYDINKKGTKEGEKKIPESLGLVPAAVFLIAIIFEQLFYGENAQRLVEYNAAALSICFIVFLGFVDDVIDLAWRYKVVLPFIASLPLLIVYHSVEGVTYVSVPKPFRAILGFQSLDLGPLYYIYMWLLSCFCTNSINIFAGLNGLEAGQSFIIATFISAHNLVQLVYGPTAVHQNHILSLFIMLPFIATTLGLLCHNWYPSKVFVGDTYTMFAGMSFAVVGILGHFSKTLMMFFIPQIINFLFSSPQLFRLWGYTCPRHRLPKLNVKTRLLEPTGDLNLVNGFLRWFGPRSERDLCICLLCFQTVCCIVGFIARYSLAGRFYDDMYI